MTIKVATDFSTAPGPRYIKEGKHSGEEFRQILLFPKLQNALLEKSELVVDLDGTAGYGTSFLEESFGGLIREDNVSLKTIQSTIKIISKNEPDLLLEIEEYLADANKESTR